MESFQTSPLEVWVKTCNIEYLQRNISKENVDVFIRKDGTTPLHLAAGLPKEADSISAATVLLSNEANPNIPNNEGETSMHIAASMGHTNLLQLLLLNGGDPLLGDRRGYSSVDWAFRGRHQSTVKFLNNHLDTEEFNYNKNYPKFTISFMRRTAVELSNFLPPLMSDSTSSFYSCKSHIQSYDVAERSFGMLIANFNKPKFNNSESGNAPNSSELPVCFSNHPFLKSMIQDEESCEEDSENDLRTLHCRLGRTLHQELSTCENMDSQTLAELNIAHLTINFSSITSSGDQIEDADGKNTYQNLEESNLFNLSSDYESSAFNPGNNTSNSENTITKVYDTGCSCYCYTSDETERSEIYSRQTDGDITAETNYKPEICTSLLLLKCPQKKRIRNTVYEATPSLRKNLCKHYDECEMTVSSIAYNSESVNNLEEQSTIQTGISPAVSPVSSLKVTSKAIQSLASTYPSLLSIAEEFLYKDMEAGIQLIERRCPTLAVLTSCGGTSHSSRPCSSVMGLMEDLASDTSFDSIGPLTDTIKAMNAKGLRENLRKLGFEPGPITPDTQTVYMRHLVRLRRKPYISQENQTSPPKYCKELFVVLKDPHSIPWEAWRTLEEEMSCPFSRPDPTRHWRDGISKSCFNYLLLDPRITKNLPLMGSAMDERERFHCFVTSVFYVGKGSRNRPYYHLYDAMKKQKSNTQNKKIVKIQEIWANDLGVVSLHVFQNTIPVEAWTREAALISALGLKNLSNSIQGTFYGPSSTWTNSQRHQLGTFLLYRSFNIFLQEGERQLRPCDIGLPFMMA